MVSDGYTHWLIVQSVRGLVFVGQAAGERMGPYCGVEQRIARQAHNLEVTGSIPVSA